MYRQTVKQTNRQAETGKREKGRRERERERERELTERRVRRELLGDVAELDLASAVFLRLLLQSLSYGLPDGAELAPQLLALAPGERDGGGLGERAWEMVLVMEMGREIRLLVDCGIPRR
mgnify:CR=1 FL=1